MTSSLTPEERADDSAKGYDLGLRVLRRELEISRKALARLAEPIPCRDMHSELQERIAVAKRALEEIQEVRRNG